MKNTETNFNYNYTETLNAFNELSKWFDLSSIYNISFTDHSLYRGGVKLQGHYNKEILRMLQKDLAIEIIEKPIVTDYGYIETAFKFENINFYVTLT
jgi:hypothetical protein